MILIKIFKIIKEKKHQHHNWIRGCFFFWGGGFLGALMICWSVLLVDRKCRHCRTTTFAVFKVTPPNLTRERHCHPCRSDTVHQRCPNAGPTSKTLRQRRWPSIGATLGERCRCLQRSRSTRGHSNTCNCLDNTCAEINEVKLTRRSPDRYVIRQRSLSSFSGL